MQIARWLVVHKPPAHTSHDIVAIARKRLWLKKIGHTGTLDPDATGVLVLAIGKATPLIQYLQGGKTYRATIRLGLVTDTHDLSGKVISEKPVPSLSQAELEQILSTFSGLQEQLPPMMSAVSYKGRRLHHLARQGIDIPDRPSRQVEIQTLNLLRFQGSELELEITCSAGTYIRTLAYDLGEKLGCGACLSQLERSRANGFSLDQAVYLEDIQPLAQFPEPGLEADWPLKHIPKMHLPDAESLWRFCNGQKLAVPPEFASIGIARVYSPAGTFFALAECRDTIFKPKLILNKPTE